MHLQWYKHIKICYLRLSCHYLSDNYWLKSKTKLLKFDIVLHFKYHFMSCYFYQGILKSINLNLSEILLVYVPTNIVGQVSSTELWK